MPSLLPLTDHPPDGVCLLCLATGCLADYRRAESWLGLVCTTAYSAACSCVPWVGMPGAVTMHESVGPSMHTIAPCECFCVPCLILEQICGPAVLPALHEGIQGFVPSV
jgi:hypothetical protein